MLIMSRVFFSPFTSFFISLLRVFFFFLFSRSRFFRYYCCCCCCSLSIERWYALCVALFSIFFIYLVYSVRFQHDLVCINQIITIYLAHTDGPLVHLSLASTESTMCVPPVPTAMPCHSHMCAIILHVNVLTNVYFIVCTRLQLHMVAKC